MVYLWLFSCSALLVLVSDEDNCLISLINNFFFFFHLASIGFWQAFVLGLVLNFPKFS